jgi:hypothetical protein
MLRDVEGGGADKVEEGRAGEAKVKEAARLRPKEAGLKPARTELQAGVDLPQQAQRQRGEVRHSRMLR